MTDIPTILHRYGNDRTDARYAVADALYGDGFGLLARDLQRPWLLRADHEIACALDHAGEQFADAVALVNGGEFISLHGKGS